jgi:hypothetical protein
MAMDNPTVIKADDETMEAKSRQVTRWIHTRTTGPFVPVDEVDAPVDVGSFRGAKNGLITLSVHI